MDIEKLREQLEIDEWTVHQIYLDHLGYPTFGIGHLVRESDPAHGANVGTKVDEARCIEAFNQDVESVIKDCKILYPDFDDLPEEVQQIVANMMFNMGRPRLSGFKKFCAAIADEDWLECAVQMEDSRWHKQVTNRANRLISRMNAIDST